MHMKNYASRHADVERRVPALHICDLEPGDAMRSCLLLVGMHLDFRES